MIAPTRTLERKRILSITLVAVFAVFVLVLIGVRWNAHNMNLRFKERESMDSGRLATTYARDLAKMHATGKAYSKKYSAMTAALTDSQTGFIAQLGVAKEYADALLADRSFDNLMTSVRHDIPGVDATFETNETAVIEKEGLMHDSLTAFATTTNAVLNNPFIVAGMDGAQEYAIGHNMEAAINGLGSSWKVLENHLSQLRDIARTKHNAADSAFREASSRNFFTALVNP